MATIVIIAVILNPGSDNPKPSPKPSTDNFITLVDGTVITLKADNGLYLSRINYGGTGQDYIEASKHTKDIFCKFFVTQMEMRKYGNAIALSGNNIYFITLQK